MGADIHVYLERYNKESKRWEHLSLYKKNDDDSFDPIQVYNSRNYELFGLLAGVRGSSHFFSECYGYIVEPRGIPEDISSYARLEWEKGKDEDGTQWWHTPTWYDFCELKTYAHLLSEMNNGIKKRDEKIRLLEDEIGKLNMQNDDEGCDWFGDYYSDEDDEEEYTAFDALSGFVNCIQDVLYEYGIWHPKPNEIRVVIWFDN